MTKTKVNMISLGCAKNLVDSERIVNDIAGRGGVICGDKEEADVIVINTCGFINSAKEESIDVILETARLKEQGRCKRLVVTGCLAQRYKNELHREIPEIDALIGINKVAKVSDSVFHDTHHNHTTRSSATKNPAGGVAAGKNTTHTGRISLTPKHYAYLKISDGCNNHCTYCTIPAIRGRYKSTSMDNIIKEAELLAANGVKELNIIAQDTTVYGLDIHKKQTLHLLLRRISQIDSIKWIRLLYTHPAHFYDELIDEIADNRKICNYVDLPIQHINDAILKRMGRKATRLQITELIARLRSRIPDLVLRTSIIVGFPGETARRFDELIDFLTTIRFERLGVFTYSHEENTPASLYRNTVSERLKRERRNALMTIQQKIAFDNNKLMIGRRVDTLIEGRCRDKGANDDIQNEVAIESNSPKPHNPRSALPTWLGRCYGDAPEVDSNIIVTAATKIRRGTFKKVTITGADGYDLVGEIRG